MPENCKHLMPSGRSSVMEYRGLKMCLRCNSAQPPSRLSWQSIKDYWHAWWTRNIVDDYENLWPGE